MLHHNNPSNLENNSFGELTKELKILNKINLGPPRNVNTELTELKASNSEFLSMIAHDLRGPFNTVIGFLSLLRQKVKNGDDLGEHQQYIDLASKSARRAIRLLDELTSWAISQNEGKGFNPKSVKLSEVLTEEIEFLSDLAAQKKIDLEFTVGLDLTVVADSQMLKTIVRNLVCNAVKFTPQDGNINIKACDYGAAVVISVKDTGVGIAKKDQVKLFDDNKNYTTLGTKAEMGSGLGLHICKKLVDMHEGVILVESTPNKGSEFKFSLPNKKMYLS